MTLADMTTQQLCRVYLRVYRDHAGCYGLDVPTLRVVAPGALRVLRDIAGVLQDRETGALDAGRLAASGLLTS